MTPELPLAPWRGRIESALAAQLPATTDEPRRLHAAMHHATLGGGKRIRALLVYATGTLLGAAPERLDAPAVAIELIHAYSLVHDDLPAMDDDALRRGRPTVHVAFDEATAILAGDALQARAFQVLAQAQAPAELRIAWCETLARAAGSQGMCGGQAIDVEATGHQLPLTELEHMHALKTGALIRAAVRMGALAGGADRRQLQRLDRFAAALGLAFQVRDDLLDVEASSAELGKTAGKDAAQAKSTYPALLGLEGAHAKLDELAHTMDADLAGTGEAGAMLRTLAELTVERRY